MFVLTSEGVVLTYAEPGCPWFGDDQLDIPVSCYYNFGKQFQALKLVCSSSSAAAPVPSATASGAGGSSSSQAQIFSSD